MSYDTSIEVRSGKLLDLQDPDLALINVHDIAHALGFTARFQGHTKFFYSVAQHSVFVADLVKKNGGDLHTQHAALFHDAHEAYLGDIPTPLKRALREAGDEYDRLTRGLDRAICERFGIDWELMHCEIVKQCDAAALVIEGRNLLTSGGENLNVSVPDALLDLGSISSHVEHAEPFSLAIEEFEDYAAYFRIALDIDAYASTDSR